jgi:Skp family chaperone for outer membrane proteins
MIRIALFAVAFLAAAGAQAQVYKCVDAAGKVVYSQDPCPANMKSDTMSRNRPSAPAAPPADSSADKAAKGDAAKSAAPKTAAEQEQAFRKRQQDQAKAAKESQQKSAETQRKEENCRGARERLAQYEIGGRLSRINAQGERYYLDDAQVEQDKARARADVALACN